MQRIYFLVPNEQLTRHIVAELLAAGRPPSEVHLVARHGLPMRELPPESIAVHEDLAEHVRKGAAAGGKVGAVAGLVALAMPAGLVLAGGTLLLLALAGAGVGGLAAALIGRHEDDPEVRRLEEALGRDEVLVAVDVEPGSRSALEEQVRSHHPEVRIMGAGTQGPGGA